MGSGYSPSHRAGGQGAAAPRLATLPFRAEDASRGAREPELRRHTERPGCEPPAGRGRVGAAGRGGGLGAGPSGLRAGARPGKLERTPQPPGGIYSLPRPCRLRGVRLASSLAHSLGSCHRSAGAAQGSPRAGEPASGGEREGANRGERGRAPAPPLPCRPAALPSCCHRSAPSLAHTWETWEGAGAECGTSGAARASSGGRRRKKRK